MTDTDVAIVGYGPTGVVLAGLLGLSGVRVTVIERADDVLDLPRAVHFDDEVMRVFQALGVAGEVESVSRVNAGMRFVDPAGRLILDWPRPQAVGPQGWFPSYRFHQPEVEAILRARVGQMPGVVALTGHEAVDVAEDENGVTLTCRDTGSGDTRMIRARYVVGCDGARSFVRGRIGGGTEDLGFHERWLVVDALLNADKPELGDFTVQHCHPTNAATYVRGPGLRRRWEIAIGDRPDAEALAPGNIWAMLERWIVPGEAELERAAIYTFHSIIAADWRRGRLLIAGDAAHQTPPFMGQGLCAGIRDAANLAWKLAACVHGGHDDALLESYQSERHPHVREYIETAARLGRLINATDSEVALKTAFLQPDGSHHMESIAPRLGPGVWDPGSAAAGRPVPQPRAADGRLADDLVGQRPAVYALSLPSGPDLALAEARGAAVLTPAEVPEIGAMLGALGLVALMVRPDRYVLGGAASPEDLTPLLDRLPGGGG